MNENAPILVVGYNRPEKTISSLKALKVSKPKTLYLAVDGPKPAKPGDARKVHAVLDSANVIDWDCDVRIIQRETNLGMRFAIPDAVSKVVREHGRVIVVEDDTLVGKDFVPFCNYQLEKFKNEPSIGHVNGYSVVPENIFGTHRPNYRLTRFPDSFAWATWERSWLKFDDSMKWANEASVSDLKKLLNTHFASVHWKIIFENVANERISSWAYRWVASLWQHNLLAVAPSYNLVTNVGFDVGSHNLTRASWTDPGIQPTPLGFPYQSSEPILHVDSDEWVSKIQNRDTLSGVMRELLVTVARTLVRETH